MVGPAVPVPVPQSVIDALTSVEITTNDTKASGFSLSFTLSNKSVLPTLFLLAGGVPIPIVRVVIVATINGTPTVLMDGMVTDTQIQPGSDAAHSVLVVTGEDLTVVMDKIDFTGLPFPAMSAEATVALILAKYLVLGVIPRIIPSILLDVPIPTRKIPVQKGTDLGYIQALADRVGYVFYLDPGPMPGMSTAYWGPKIKVGVPQPALNVDFDAHTNAGPITFAFKSNERSLPRILIQNEETKVPIPIILPDISPLNPPLGLAQPLALKLGKPKDMAKFTATQAIMIGLAQASKSADTVTGTGTLDVARYGRVLRSRALVGVRGAGLAFDGLYYVSEVKHKIKRGEYTQSFTLSRNGLISTVPVVPV